MVDERIKDTIATFGFSENEIEVYVAGLELGNATAKQLSKQSKLDLKTTIITIELLKKKDLLSEKMKEDELYYTMVPFEDVFVDKREY